MRLKHLKHCLLVDWFARKKAGPCGLVHVQICTSRFSRDSVTVTQIIESAAFWMHFSLALGVGTPHRARHIGEANGMKMHMEYKSKLDRHDCVKILLTLNFLQPLQNQNYSCANLSAEGKIAKMSSLGK